MNEDNSASQHSFVLTRDLSCPSFEQISEAFIGLFPEYPALEQPEVDNEGTLSFNIAGLFASVSNMQVAYPNEERADMCEGAWWWPEAEAETADSKNHILIAVLGDTDPIDHSTLLSHLTCAVIKASESSAVIWGPASSIRKSEEFLEVTLACLDAEPPLPLTLWLDIQVGVTEENESLFYTTGMTTLGYHEVEVQGSDADPNDLLDMMLPLLLYIVGNDVVFNDGDTFGGSEEERTSVHYAASMFDEESEVLVIDI